MPYPWEKGFLPTAVEEWFNEDLDTAGANQTPQDILLLTGPKRRLRAIWRYADVCRQLRMGEGHFNSIAVVTPENSIIKSGLFDWAEVGNFDWRSVIARDWFGMELVDKVWYRQNPETWPSGKSIGHWNGYAGNVELIVCETLQRMLELSLGVDHLVLTQAPGNPQQLENDLRTRAKRVWPVYMFLTCPNPWFESWVTWQCHSATAPLRGQVTAICTRWNV